MSWKIGRKRLLFLTILIIGSILVTTPVGAQTPQPPNGRIVLTPNRPAEGAITAEISSLLSQRGPVKVIVELASQPTTIAYAETQKKQELFGETPTRAAVRQLAIIRDEQANFLNAMSQKGIQANVIYQTQRVYNGIAMRVDAARLRELAALPGVKAIHPLVTKQLDNNYSVPTINAHQAWQNFSNAGENIRVGIIDSGIDYLHTDFGGPGTGYTANDTTKVLPGEGYPSAKVVGGYDFAGDAYDANSTNPAKFNPVPDPDPMDCGGHGSHVAGTVAGYGTNADGTTFSGPYNATTPFSTMDIGPGVAPQAKLYALRVFGCSGSTDLTDQAIEWAVDPNGDGDFSDHLDVINMSLGSSYGSVYDSSAIASDNAAIAGVIVVASAGNSGDTTYITGSPAAATRVISVASSVDPGNINMLDQFRINTPSSIQGLYGSVEGSGASTNLKTTGDITADVAYNPANLLGCSAFTPGYFTGKIAYVDRGTCTFSTKVTNAQNAGARAVIVGNNSSAAPIVMALNSANTIPAVMIFQSVGTTIKAQLAASEIVNATLYATDYRLSLRYDPGANTALTDTLSTFTSRGPRRFDSFLKPDITAPGDTIYSVSNGTGKFGTSMSGTSMAAPHVAGVMALLKFMHPDWSVEEMKALAMNTANNDLYTGQSKTGNMYAPQRVGAGRVDVNAAGQNQVILFNAEDHGAVSVSFGAPEVTAPVTVYKTVTLVNKGNLPEIYSPSFDYRNRVNGVTYSLVDMGGAPLSIIQIAPGGSTQFKVKMTADPAVMLHSRETTLSSSQTGLPRYYMAEASGLIVLQPAFGATPLRLPVYAAPRPASTLKSTVSEVTMFPLSGTVNIPQSGISVNTTSTSPAPVGELALTSAYQLMLTSPNEDLGTLDDDLEKAIDSADLQYVGVMSDAHLYTNNVADPGALIFFGLATYANWSSLNDVEFDIYIDVDRDGTDDYVLFNYNYGRASGGSNPEDNCVTVLLELPVASPAVLTVEEYLNGVSPAIYNTVAFNNNVVALPVYAFDLGLDPADPTFDFYVVTYSREAPAEVDVTDVMTYNPGQLALDTTGGITGVPVWAGANSINVMFDKTLGEPNDILLLHHHNANLTTTPRAEVVKVWDHRYFMPMIGR